MRTLVDGEVAAGRLTVIWEGDDDHGRNVSAGVYLYRLTAGAYNDALAGATPYLKLFGTVVGGWLMAREALAARGMLDTGRGDASFARAKLATTRFYLEQLVPTAAGGAAAVTAGSDVLYEADLTVR